MRATQCDGAISREVERFYPNRMASVLEALPYPFGFVALAKKASTVSTRAFSLLVGTTPAVNETVARPFASS